MKQILTLWENLKHKYVLNGNILQGFDDFWKENESLF